MFAVIFKATMNVIDDKYLEFAESLRKLAFEKYGCTEFVSASEGDLEIAISYWRDEAAILAWKQDATHLAAQKLGQEQWYKRYEIDVVKVVRSYQFQPPNDALGEAESH